MLSLQPIHLWKYLSKKTTKLPPGVKSLFYLSWEDAFWDLLSKKNIPPGSIILVPEFFCGDVERNTISHGYRLAHYPVSATLRTSISDLLSAVKKFSPVVIIIFHPVGIANPLISSPKIVSLSRHILLVEDCVHRIIEPSKLKLVRPNHYIIDSLRKVLPLQGSFIYGRGSDMDYSLPPLRQSFFYSLRVHALWVLMQLFANLTQAKISESVMVTGYDLIGKSSLPARGWPLFSFLHHHLNHSHIQSVKKHQVEIYEKHLLSLLPQTIPYTVADKSQLRGWPILLGRNASRILVYLRSHGLLVRFELADSVWSQHHKIIYLPLGLHISLKQQLAVCHLVSGAINKYS